MPALEPKTLAPEFELPLLEGGRFNLAEARGNGPVVLAFLKVSCPVCHFALPFLERIHQRFAAGKVAFIAVSQNSAADTRAFARQFGISFPIVLDASPYPVSSSYGLTNVPTVFLVESDGDIARTIVGFVKQDYEDLASFVADTAHLKATPLFAGDRDIPAMRPG